MRTENTIDFIEIHQQDIVDILKSLKLNKAVGLDNISHHILRNTAETISLPLLKLFQKCLQQSIFTSLWKKARVMPLYKKDDKHVPSNYRPIALLSTVGKVFERLLHKGLHNYMLDNNLLYKLQSGFLPNNCTVYQLLEIYHNVCVNREEKKNTCLVFCDISKAFDKVWHAGLLCKMKAYEIGGSLFALLENYLSDRQQCVTVNSLTSEFRYTNAGVPQGSVLGPFLFLLYINDIADNLANLARLFADDTSLSASSRDKREIEYSINSDLEILLDWSKRWLVTFNPSKTEVLYISSTVTDNITLTFGNTTLVNTEKHTHLGVTFSSNCKWTSHVDIICKSVCKKVNALRKLKYTLSRDKLNKIFNTFILPSLEYACKVWDGLNINDAEKLEKVQLDAGRIVTGLPLFSSREAIYFETGWEPLKDRRERRKLCLFYKIHNKLVPTFLSDIVQPMIRDNQRNLRNDNDYTLPKYRLQTTENSYFPSTIKLWNDLDRDLRYNQTYNQFKHALLNQKDVFIVPKYFLVGDRKQNIILTRLRNMCSILKADLFSVNLTGSPSCQCGTASEDVYHFFFSCPLYTRARDTLAQRLNRFFPITIEKLLFGDVSLPDVENEIIMISVQDYIKSSKRF